MKKFWMLYRKAMKQSKYFLLLYVALFGISFVVGTLNPPHEYETIRDLIQVACFFGIGFLAPIVFGFLSRDEWNRGNVYQLHALPVRKSEIFLSRIAVAVTFMFVTSLGQAIQTFFMIEEKIHHTLSLSLRIQNSLSMTYDGLLYNFVLMSMITVSIALFRSIRRLRDIIGILSFITLLWFTVWLYSFMKNTVVYMKPIISGPFPRFYFLRTVLVLLGIVYLSIALVLYEKRAEI